MGVGAGIVNFECWCVKLVLVDDPIKTAPSGHVGGVDPVEGGLGLPTVIPDFAD